jgi:hypothetical protein
MRYRINTANESESRHNVFYDSDPGPTTARESDDTVLRSYHDLKVTKNYYTYVKTDDYLVVLIMLTLLYPAQVI